MELTVRILPELELSDPFMIAASHWTANERCFRALAPYSPSAVTLKTTSTLHGGDGTGILHERDRRKLEDSFGHNFALYTNGPKTQELIDLPTTINLIQCARRWLSNTKIGLSVLSGENYVELADALPVDKCNYVELNLKYQFRSLTIKELNEALNNLNRDIKSFFAAFSGIPTLVKLPREFTAIIPVTDLTRVFYLIAGASAGVIVANSKRVIVPPSRTSGNDIRELSSGVLVGEHLFLDTYNTIRTLKRQCENMGFELAVIASGGIMDIGATIDVMAAGAAAVQLCTVLDVRKPPYLSVLRAEFGPGVHF